NPGRKSCCLNDLMDCIARRAHTQLPPAVTLTPRRLNQAQRVSLPRGLRRPALHTLRFPTTSPVSARALRAPSGNAWQQWRGFATLHLCRHPPVFCLQRVYPDVLVPHLFPRLREVETTVDRLGGPRQERLQQDRDTAQLLDQVVQDALGRVGIALDQLPRLR